MSPTRVSESRRLAEPSQLTVPNLRSTHGEMYESAVAPAKKPAVAPPRPAVEPEREPNTVPHREPVPEPKVVPRERPDTTCPVRR